MILSCGSDSPMPMFLQMVSWTQVMQVGCFCSPKVLSWPGWVAFETVHSFLFCFLGILLLFFPPARGQETKQELPSDLALPIFSLMQKASVCFSPVA